MGSLLLYSDVLKAIDDITQHPDASTTADFITAWDRQSQGVMGMGFLFALRRAISKKDIFVVTKTDISKANLLDFKEFGIGSKAKLRFAASFAEFLISEEYGYTFSVESTSKSPALRQKYDSFGIAEKNKPSLYAAIKEINPIINFLDDKDVELFVQVLTEPNLVESILNKKQILLTCPIGIAAFVFLEIEKFTNKKIKRKIFNTFPLFLTEDGEHLTSTNFTKAINAAPSAKSSGYIEKFERIMGTFSRHFKELAIRNNR